jgi:NAD(P)-dependent dehydrogenase (short-subunit alcohol dehydrogenase family)
MTTTLITGANRGLGFEVARQLVAAGHQVWIGARDEARGEQAADTVGARFVRLDVTDDASVTAAVETVADWTFSSTTQASAADASAPAKLRPSTCGRFTRRMSSERSAFST